MRALVLVSVCVAMSGCQSAALVLKGIGDGLQAGGSANQQQIHCTSMANGPWINTDCN